MRGSLSALCVWGALLGCRKSAPPAAGGPVERATDGAATEATADAGLAVPDALTLDRDGGVDTVDPDGVRMLYPTNPQGRTWRLGSTDPNAAANFEIENGTIAKQRMDGRLDYWNVESHPVAYASGGQGWTSRLHIYASGSMTQLYTWKTQKGWLATPSDLRNQEFTVFTRAHMILDGPRAAMTLKIRGGRHTATDGDLASCTMMLFAGKETSGVARFGKELFHPMYDYVKLTPGVPTSLTDDAWVGLKLISYQRVGEPKQVHYQLFIDTDPFNVTTGKPRNGWTMYSEYVDLEGKNTGSYTKLADWGGMLTTFRTDGLHDVDFALLSVREILVP